MSHHSRGSFAAKINSTEHNSLARFMPATCKNLTAKFEEIERREWRKKYRKLVKVKIKLTLDTLRERMLEDICFRTLAMALGFELRSSRHITQCSCKVCRRRIIILSTFEMELIVYSACFVYFIENSHKRSFQYFARFILGDLDGDSIILESWLLLNCDELNENCKTYFSLSSAIWICN